ncbi:MAG: RES domain-containing protein [Methylococcaceae bacterium]|nr:RES domain-containing protein [Methylococcaceae bacterium]
MVTVYRLCKTKYAANAFDGEGAFQFGGRWNSLGTRVVYTAEHLSLAALEMLVYIQDETLLSTYSFIVATFYEQLITAVENVAKLPKNWQTSPPPYAVQKIGDEWAKKQLSAVLCVPSVLIPSEANYLIDPRHADFAEITFGEPQRFVFNERLLKVK